MWMWHSHSYWKIMARCEQATPGYEAATYKDAIAPSVFVKDCDKPSSLHVLCAAEGQKYCGQSQQRWNQLNPHLQVVIHYNCYTCATLMNEDWRGLGTRPKILVLLNHKQLLQWLAEEILGLLLYNRNKESRKPLLLLKKGQMEKVPLPWKMMERKTEEGANATPPRG